MLQTGILADEPALVESDLLNGPSELRGHLHFHPRLEPSSELDRINDLFSVEIFKMFSELSGLPTNVEPGAQALLSSVHKIGFDYIADVLDVV